MALDLALDRRYILIRIGTMKDLTKPFGIISVLFFIIMAISPVKEHYREWRIYPREYNEYIKDLPQRITPVQETVKQVWVPELDVVDRCTTCHLGLTNAAFRDAPQPFKSHPEMYHQPERFGCTPCHQGQGLATNVESSFGFNEDWEYPMFASPFVESSCGTCHNEDSVSHAPLLNRGKELLAEYNCAGCHNITGIDRGFIPSLDGIGNKVSKEWLKRWLTNPSSVSQNTVMPDFLLSEEEVELLSDFLMTFTETTEGSELDPLPEVLKSEIPESLFDEGETLFRNARCISCHSINSRGGTIAVELGTVASKASKHWIYNFIKNPGKLQPGITMPQYGFSEEEIQAVTAYISEEFIDWDLSEEEESTEYQTDPNFFEKGLKIYRTYNCGGCHSLSGYPVAENFGPDLSDLRNKPHYQLEFGQKDIPHTKEQYIIGKLKDPRGFLENSLMPQFQFDATEVLTITTALFSLQSKEIPAKYTVKKEVVPSIEVQGEFGKIVEKYQCLTCHVIFDKGGTVAPDLTKSGSKLQGKWIKEYFKLPYTVRPILTERMPNLFMSNEEIEIATNFITGVFRDDELEPEIEFLFSEEQIAKGKDLYNNTYGCQSCHQLQGQGGYVGPPLDDLSKRLKPGWVFKRLKDPQKYDPDIPEPNFDLTDEEALALTAFILGQGNKNEK